MSTKIALSKKPAAKQTTFIKKQKQESRLKSPVLLLQQEERSTSPMFGNQLGLMHSRNQQREGSSSQASEIDKRKNSQSSVKLSNSSVHKSPHRSNSTLLQRQMMQSFSTKNSNKVVPDDHQGKPQNLKTEGSRKSIPHSSILQQLSAINAQARLDSSSPVRPNNQVQGQGSAVGHKGRYNVLLFYSSLINVISKNEKSQVLCSHLLKQLNSVLNEAYSNKTAVSSMMSLLKAVDYFRDGNFQLTEQLMNPETPEQQAQSVLFYLKHIRSVGVSSMFSLNDILDCNTEPILLHLVQLFLVLTKDSRLRDAQDWHLSPAEVAQVRMDLEPLRMLNDETFKTTDSIKDVRIVELRYEMRALQKQMEAKNQQMGKLESENGKLKLENQKLQDFIKSSRVATLKPEASPKHILSPQLPQVYQQLASAQEKIQSQEHELTELKMRAANKIREYQLKEEMISEYIQQIKSDHIDQLKQLVAPQLTSQPEAPAQTSVAAQNVAALESQIEILKQSNAKLESDLANKKENVETASKEYLRREESLKNEVADLKQQMARAQQEINQFKDDLKQKNNELEQVKSETTKTLTEQLDQLRGQHKKEIEVLKQDHFDKMVQAESVANKKVKDQQQSAKTETDKANLLVGTLQQRLAAAMAAQQEIELLKKQVEQANQNLKSVEDRSSGELGLREKLVQQLTQQLNCVKKAMDETKEEHEEELEGMAAKMKQLKDTVASLKEEVAQAKVKISEAQAQASDKAFVAELQQKCEAQAQQIQGLNIQLAEVGKAMSEHAEANQKLKQASDADRDELCKAKADLEKATKECDLTKQQAQTRQEVFENLLEAKEKDAKLAHQVEKSLRTENEICKSDLKKYMVQADAVAKANKRIEALESQVQSEAFAKRNLKSTIEQLQDRVEELTDQLEQLKGMSGQETKTMESPIGGMGMAMPGMSPMGGMVMPGMGMSMPGMSPMAGMSMLGMGSMGLGMPSLSPNSNTNGNPIDVSLSSPDTKTNSQTQDNYLLNIPKAEVEKPLSPNASHNESIADNFKAMLQPPQLQRDLTKILEEAEYGHESDSSYASSVHQEDSD